MAKEYIDVPFEIKTEDVQDNGIFEGYASTFGGSPDSYGDIIKYGAFTETLIKGGRNGYGIAMLWQHQPDQPVGVWMELTENRKGLKVKGQLAMGTELGKSAYELMKMGALKGLSIGYEVLEKEDSENGKIRYLKKINLWEISLVTFPANTRAQVNNIKAIESAKTERELETALRDAGLSKKASQYLVSMCKESLRESKKTSMESLLDKLKQTHFG